MPTLVRDEAGAYFVDTGGGSYQPVTEEQARRFQGGQGAASGAFQAAGQGLENLITGAGSLLSDNPYWLQANQAGQQQSEALNLANPITSGAAQFAPQAAVGLATAGASIPATAGVEALLGAATTPEAPIQGALLGGILGGAGAAAPGAVSSLARRGREALPDLPFLRPRTPYEVIPENPGGMRPGEVPPIDGGSPAGPGPVSAVPAGPTPTPSPSMNPPDFAAPDAAPTPTPAPRMAERVTETLGEADRATDVANVRVMEGTLPPDTLRQYGIPVSKAQQALLEARGQQAGAAARTALREEEAQMSNPITGGRLREIRDAQQQGATNFITRELDVPAGINLTDPMLSDVFARVGGRMDQIADEMGTVPLTQEIRNDFADILGQTTGGHKGQLQDLADEIVAKADLGGGMMTGQDWSEMRTKINRMIEAGMRQGNIGKVSDAGQLMDTMVNAMETNLPDVTRAELDRLRKQYAIASTLSKPGARNADGQVNPLSFYNNWKRPQSKKRVGTDDVGQFMNTLVTLTAKRTPDSGTAGRLLGNLTGAAVDAVPGGSMLRRVLGQ